MKDNNVQYICCILVHWTCFQLDLLGMIKQILHSSESTYFIMYICTAMWLSWHIYLFRFLDPIFFGDYPEVMRTILGDRLPTLTKKESELVKGSADFVGINHYTSYYITDRPTGATSCTGNIYVDPMVFPVCMLSWPISSIIVYWYTIYLYYLSFFLCCKGVPSRL